MPGDPVTFLADWYARQCDGDWEHEYGIEIRTLDNPGWLIRVNLAETELEGAMLPRTRTEEDAGEGSWMDVSSDGAVFTGACDERSLALVLARFREFCESAADAEPPPPVHPPLDKPL